jgi:alkaline phosphatase D
VFQKAPAAPNLSPYAGLQFFGEINIDGRSGALRMDLKDLANQTLFTKILEAKGNRPRSYADENDERED